MMDMFSMLAAASTSISTNGFIKQELDHQAIDTKCGEIQKRHRCDHCLELFETYDEMLAHKKSHPRVKQQHACENCGKVYGKKQHLRRHMLKTHNIVLEKGRIGRKSKFVLQEGDPKPYKCPECVREFSKYKQLNKHMKVHEKRFCHLCQDYVQTYAEHMRKEHNFEVPRPFQCDICKRSYRTRANIKTHMKFHMVQNRMCTCHLCNKSFRFARDLKKHMISHSQDRPIICDICGEGFKTSATLKRHAQTHTGEKPFHCSYCARRFAVKGSLNLHVRVHTNERPFVCSICQSGFKDASTLRVHKRQHSGESPLIFFYKLNDTL